MFPQKYSNKKILFTASILYASRNRSVEFVLEGALFVDKTEDFDGQIKYVLTTITFVVLALICPTYKDLSIIHSWKELEITLVDQGLRVVVICTFWVGFLSAERKRNWTM